MTNQYADVSVLRATMFQMMWYFKFPWFLKWKKLKHGTTTWTGITFNKISLEESIEFGMLLK